MFAFVSVDRGTLLKAIRTLMACVPKPWTPRMFEEAVTLVLHHADEWRGSDCEQIEHVDLYRTALRLARRRCPDAFSEQSANIASSTEVD